MDILLNPIVAWIGGIVLGVIFDEFFTTKFAWLRKEGRKVISDAVKKL